MRSAVVPVDHYGLITAWSVEAAALFGWDAASAVRRPWVDVLVAPEERTSGEFSLSENASAEFYVVCVRQGGDFFPAEITALPGVSRDGSDSHVLVFRDVTDIQRLRVEIFERDRLLDQVRKSEAFVDSLLENLPDMIFVKDARDLKFVRFNRAAENLLGYTREEMLGKSDFDLFPKIEAEFFTAKDRVVLASRQTLESPEEAIHSRTRGLRTLRTKKVPIHDGEGNPLFLLGISEDITELRKAQKVASSAIDSREELLQIVTHDLRNPLSVILLSLQAVRRALQAGDAKSRESLQTHLNRIARASATMRVMIEEVLDVAYIESGKFRIDWTPLEAAALLSEAKATMEPIAAEKRVEFRVEAPESARISGDRDRLLQVFSNLIGNAIKFTPENGTVVARMRVSDGDAVFTVQDTGEGIPMDELPYIFDRFRQVKPSKRRTGVGLGLSIAKGIVEAHGGRIWVESREGLGTTVHFTVPAREAAVKKAG